MNEIQVFESTDFGNVRAFGIRRKACRRTGTAGKREGKPT